MILMYKEQILKIIKNNKHFSKNSNINIKELGMGENNLNYLVTIGNQKYVFRISLKKHLEKNACKEFKFLKLIPKDVAPKPIFLDKTKKEIPHYYSVLGYVEGESHAKWNKKEIQMHAKVMARLHSKKYNYWQTIGVKNKRFSLYKKLLKDLKGFKDVTKDKNISSLVKDFINYIKKNDPYFTELKKFHLIHGDLCADNVVFHKNQIHYIDWEWCGVRDNAEDIARVYTLGKPIQPWYIGLNEKEVDYMLREYNKYAKGIDKTLKERVIIWNNYVLFTDMLYFFWKVKNHNKFQSKLPKKRYIEASRTLFQHFSKQKFN